MNDIGSGWPKIFCYKIELINCLILGGGGGGGKEESLCKGVVCTAIRVGHHGILRYSQQ